MYAISLGFDNAIGRIEGLMKNGHHAEALVTAVFTFEKLLRRSLRRCAESRGFTSTHANILFDRMGFEQLKRAWPCFERDHRPLNHFVGKEWQHLPPAVTMRNKLVHGERVYNLKECEKTAKAVLRATKVFRKNLISDVKIDGWKRLRAKKKSALVWLSS